MGPAGEAQGGPTAFDGISEGLLAQAPSPGYAADQLGNGPIAGLTLSLHLLSGFDAGIGSACNCCMLF